MVKVHVKLASHLDCLLQEFDSSYFSSRQAFILFYKGVISRVCHASEDLRKKNVTNIFLFNPFVDTKELLANIIMIRIVLAHFPLIHFRHNYIRNATTKPVFDLVIRLPSRFSKVSKMFLTGKATVKYQIL